MSFADPARIENPAAIGAYLTAMRRYHLRPLVLLNANSLGPGPHAITWATLRVPAPAGATTVSLTPDSVAGITPGLSGFDTEDPYPQHPGVLITSVSADGLAALSRPLPVALPAGATAITTLRYRPFAPPYLTDGSSNPRFEATLAGWLTYLKGMLGFVRDTYGSSSFDVEVWNELGFGSAFLDERNYYDPVPDPGSKGDVDAALLARTVRWLHDPANGLSGVRVGDGFSNQEPFTSGATVPTGTDAIDKHPYAGTRVFPDTPQAGGIVPLGAFGDPDTIPTGTGATARAHVFIPRYRVFMPEYYLTGTQTETLMRDLSPITTSIYGVPHGAVTHPPGSPPPRLWITETNLDATDAAANGLPEADLPELQAKAALRYFVSYASEGAQAIDLFAAAGGGCCQLIPQAFFDAVDADPHGYPASLGGRAMQAVGRMTSALAGAQRIRHPRQLSLTTIAQRGDDAQFSGAGTPALPSLYNRDVLAFFPYQVASHRFVSAVYVMSRDLTHRYTDTPPPGSTPYDLPPEQFRLTIGDLDACRARVSLADPLIPTHARARVIARRRTRIVVQLPVTDSPRLLTIQDGPVHGRRPSRCGMV
jgi:hypothetical protein